MDVGAGDPGFGVFGDRRTRLWSLENDVKCGWMSALETPAMESLATGDPGYGVFGDPLMESLATLF